LFNENCTNNTIYSSHTFIFPFKLDLYPTSYKLDEIDKKIDKHRWEAKKYEVDKAYKYNEFSYFYPYVQEILFNKKEIDKNQASIYYKYRNSSGTYEIDISNDKTYSLDIVSITLRIYKSGIAILSYNLENKHQTQASIKDILKINDFGRRIYPPFVTDDNHQFSTSNTKQALLANKLTIRMEECIIETFESFKSNSYISNTIMSILGKDTFIYKADQSIKSNMSHIEIVPIIDDRMFTICWYENDQLATDLQVYDDNAKTYSFARSDKWHELVFIDGKGSTCQSENLKEHLLKNATYDRWVKKGTLYGIGKHSFICLTKEEKYSKSLKIHSQTIYNHIAHLILMQRASLVHFSQRVSTISENIQSNSSNIDDIQKLYADYIYFINRLHFREVTAQDQGNEIYEMMLKQLNIASLTQSLDDEIAELHNYSNLIQEKQRNDTLDNIAKLGAMLLPPSLVLGFFGVSTLPSPKVNSPTIWAIFSIFALLLALFFSTKIFNFEKEKSIKKSYILLTFISILLSFGLSNKEIIGNTICMEKTIIKKTENLQSNKSKQ
jgi:hypothetical protein